MLSHTWSWLSMQTTLAVLCVGQWSTLKIVKSEDVHVITKMDGEAGADDREMEDGWDLISLDKE